MTAAQVRLVPERAIELRPIGGVIPVAVVLSSTLRGSSRDQASLNRRAKVGDRGFGVLHFLEDRASVGFVEPAAAIQDVGDDLHQVYGLVKRFGGRVRHRSHHIPLRTPGDHVAAVIGKEAHQSLIIENSDELLDLCRSEARATVETRIKGRR